MERARWIQEVLKKVRKNHTHAWVGGWWPFSWAGKPWGRKGRVREEDNHSSLDTFSLSHRGCARPLTAWHQPPSPTCFCTHSPPSPHPCSLMTELLVVSQAYYMSWLRLMPLQGRLSSPSSVCRVPGHYLAQIGCLLRKFPDSPEETCSLFCLQHTNIFLPSPEYILPLSFVDMSVFLTRWSFYNIEIRKRHLLFFILEVRRCFILSVNFLSLLMTTQHALLWTPEGCRQRRVVVEFCESESRSWVEEESGASISVIEPTRNTPPKQSKNALLACYLIT